MNAIFDFVLADGFVIKPFTMKNAVFHLSVHGIGSLGYAD